jgi:hypothetical protein
MNHTPIVRGALGLCKRKVREVGGADDRAKNPAVVVRG